ncbi:uncharacterized protein LOC106169412 [Lingula anatina]|uniref:Uncharacterized protein LOC106169412 n=1 Tax=Lingula anatina TaxID=7574 RepID=A0A2R2MNV4_LINAN|nr:uncharacterized protein LOC106169412 [Lingula anatina]|eukprot:XP_023931722.1 uncharacterized protein LOC106169412 [Lingula anatina]
MKILSVECVIFLAIFLQWVNGNPSSPNHLHRHGHYLPRNATRNQNSVLSYMYMKYPDWNRDSNAPKNELLADGINKKCGAHEYFSEKKNRCLRCSCCNVVSRHDKTKTRKLTPLTECTSNSQTRADFACSQDFSWVCDTRVQNDTTKPYNTGFKETTRSKVTDRDQIRRDKKPPKSSSSNLKYTPVNALFQWSLL